MRDRKTDPLTRPSLGDRLALDTEYASRVKELFGGGLPSYEKLLKETRRLEAIQVALLNEQNQYLEVLFEELRDIPEIDAELFIEHSRLRLNTSIGRERSAIGLQIARSGANLVDYVCNRRDNR